MCSVKFAVFSFDLCSAAALPVSGCLSLAVTKEWAGIALHLHPVYMSSKSDTLQAALYTPHTSTLPQQDHSVKNKLLLLTRAQPQAKPANSYTASAEFRGGSSQPIYQGNPGSLNGFGHILDFMVSIFHMVTKAYFHEQKYPI